MAKKSSVRSMPTWVQQALLGVPAAVAVETILMVETDPQRAALWYRVTEVASDTVVAMGQLPWAPWTDPAELPTHGTEHLGQVLREAIPAF